MFESATALLDAAAKLTALLQLGPSLRIAEARVGLMNSAELFGVSLGRIGSHQREIALLEGLLVDVAGYTQNLEGIIGRGEHGLGWANTYPGSTGPLSP